MKIKSFGCSFIYGSDLGDEDYITPSQLTWPALYSKKLGHEYECHARPGIGNLQIAEKILIQSATEDPAFFIIGWTWVDRFDYNHSTFGSWRTLMPSDTTDLAHTYYRDLHSQYRDKLTTLMTVKLVIDTLKQKKHSFIMTYMDELMFETAWHTSPAVTDLQNYIRPYMTTFEGQSFLEWSRKNQFPESPGWHPLESAHQAAVDYILDFSVNKK